MKFVFSEIKCRKCGSSTKDFEFDGTPNPPIIKFWFDCGEIMRAGETVCDGHEFSMNTPEDKLQVDKNHTIILLALEWENKCSKMQENKS